MSPSQASKTHTGHVLRTGLLLDTTQRGGWGRVVGREGAQGGAGLVAVTSIFAD